MSVIRDFRYEIHETNRQHEIEPLLNYAVNDLSDTCDDLRRLILRLQDTSRYGNTGAGRSYLGKAFAATADALDSVRKAREELR